VAAPEYVPNRLGDQPRTGLKLPPARPWRADRPADLGPGQPTGPQLGYPGPDQGYALTLAVRFDDRLEVAEGESREDAVAGCVGVAMRRAAIFGRAPVIHDLDVAFRVWGFLGQAPPELVELRRPLFQAASHHYWDQRDIVDHVPEETLRLSPGQVQSRFPADWRALLAL
jgi:hypothetical protein